MPKALIGDYFISCNPPADFMGTAIEFGSDTFKTWEDILVFFGRILEMAFSYPDLYHEAEAYYPCGTIAFCRSQALFVYI